MKYKLICIDIDGTLLTDQKELLPEVRDSLRNVSDRGIKIALVSGRMPVGVDVIEAELGIPCIKVCSAGTYILAGEQCIDAEYLSVETMKEIYIEIAEKYNVPLWIFRGRDWYVTKVDELVEREAEIIQWKPEIISMGNLAEKWSSEDAGPNKLLFAVEQHKLREIYLEMKKREWKDIDMAYSADTYMEIFPSGVTKGTALSTICRKLDICMEETVAFGDQELDIPMIEVAGMGIAMGNAIPELKEMADFVTKSNNEAGVAYALEHYLEHSE